MRLGGLFFGVAVAFLLVGCGGGEQRASEAPSKDGGRRNETAPAGRAATRSSVAELKLRDWVVDPPGIVADAPRCELRLVSAAPNLTEICFALGVGDCLVARTSYCAYPPAVAVLPSIGALTDMSAETLLALRPDVVLVAGTSRAQVERLEALGIRYEATPDQSIEDLYEAIALIAELTDRAAVGDALIAGIRVDLDRVEARYRVGVGEGGARRALVLIGALQDPPRPPFVAGAGSYYNDVLERLGVQNVAADVGPFGQVPLERIVRADPDVIIELSADGARTDAAARAAWAQLGQLQAVERKRVVVIAGGQHYILGPRIATTFATIGAAVRGE